MKVLVVLAAACLAVAMAISSQKPAMEFQKVEAINPDGSTRAYYWSNVTATFDEAVLYCLNRGQQLLMIKDDVKQKQIESLMAVPGQHQQRWLWLWYRDWDFFWGDGTKAVYTNFYDPVFTFTSYRVIILATTSSYPGQWFTEYTSNTDEHYFTCQPFD